MELLSTRLRVLSVLTGVALATQPVFAQNGACCLGDGTCTDTNQPGCDLGSGDFLGESSTCATTICLGACCLEEKTCAEDSRDGCDALAGTFQGPNTTCAMHCAAKLPTIFNFQGQLKHAGVPLSGTADLEFSLWTTAKAGDQVGTTLFIENVSITGGLLSVPLGFDVSAFSGNSRWLEIAVRSPHDETNTDPFTTLVPRQLITATPYALQTRGLFVDSDGNVGIGTDSPDFPLTVDCDGGVAIRATVRANGVSAVTGETTRAAGLSIGVHGFASGRTGAGVGVQGSSVSPDGYGGIFKGRFRIEHNSTTQVAWPVGIDNRDQSRKFLVGMRLTDDGFFDMTNDALDASPNFARLNNTGNWTAVSDRRVKRDIQPLSGVLDKAMALEAVSFRFKNDKPESEEKEIGFIAQDVRKQFPSLVTDGDVLTLNYAGLSVVAIAAIQEQHRIIEQLAKENTEREAEIGELRHRLERLEGLLSTSKEDTR